MSHDPPSPEQSVERYAAMAVALREPFASREDILGDARVSDARWREIEANWVTRIRSNAEVAARYHGAFKKAKEALRNEQSAREVARDVRAPVMAGRGVDSTSHGSSDALGSEAVLEVAAAPAAAAGPLEALAPLAAPMAAASADELRTALRPDPLDVTAPPGEPTGPALPFAGRASTPPSALDEALPPQDAIDETAELRLEDLQELGEVMPFETTPELATKEVDETAFVEALAIEEPLPFRDGDGQAPPAALELPVHDEVGETGFVQALDISEPLPFASSLDSSPGSAERADGPAGYCLRSAPLSLGQLAAVFVELQHGGREEVLARYGLTEEVYAALEAERRALPSEDVRYMGAWDEVCQRYRRWREGRDGRQSGGEEGKD